MARVGITYHDVAAAAQRVRQRGDEPTVDRVRSELGTGSRSTLGPMLKRWKTGSEAAADLGGLPADLAAAVKALYERVQQSADERLVQEREALQALEQKWRMELTEARQRCEAVVEQRRELEKANEALRKDNGAQADALQQEQQRVALLTSKLETSQEKLSETTATVQEMKQENRDIRSHFEHYQQEIAEDRRHERHQFYTTQSGLEAQVSQLTQQLRSSEQERDRLRQQRDQINQRYEASQDHAEDLKERLHASHAVVTQWKTRTDTLAATVDRLQRERDSDAEHRERLGTALTDSEKQLAVSQQKISDLRARVAAADDRDKLLSDQNRDLLQEKAVLKGQLKQLQTSLAK